jgi:HEAT repeat protein
MSEYLLAKIEKLKSASGRKEIKFLIASSSNHDPEVRYRSIERMIEFVCENEQFVADVQNVIKKHLCDSDELVRCEALEFFEYFGVLEHAESVRHLLHDSSSLVRGQAAMTLAGIGDKESVPQIELALCQAVDVEKAPMFAALIKLGVSYARDGLLKLLNSASYQARCAAANLLDMSINELENQEVVTVLRQALIGETSSAVISSMQNALNRLMEQENPSLV